MDNQPASKPMVRLTQRGVVPHTGRFQRDRNFCGGIQVAANITLTLLFVLNGCATSSNDSKFNAEVQTAAPLPMAASKQLAAPPVNKSASSPYSRPGPQRCKIQNDSVAWVQIHGACRNGLAQGQGEARSTDSIRSYRGGFVNGAFHGEGRYDWGNGIHYTGVFERGIKNGRGSIVYPDTRRYVGGFKDDLYHGRGVYTETDGSVYEGEFRAGRFSGRGDYRWTNGDHYTGEFLNDGMEGTGIYRRANGERYTGSFKNNQRQGQGAYHWPNGDHYAGEFRDNEIEGEGVYTHADGSRYIGNFQAGKKHGQGRLASAQGERLQRWEHGVKISEEATLSEAPAIPTSPVVKPMVAVE